MKKKRILWVVYDFIQAGGQRYVYEICKALNKEKFEIDFLKVGPMNYDKHWDHEFYYTPTLELGCKVFFLEDLFGSKKKNFPKSGLLIRTFNYFKRKIIPEKSVDKKGMLEDFFRKYDFVNFSGTSVFEICLEYNINPPNGFIHILTFGFQKPDMYKGYEKVAHYKFISPVTLSAAKKDLDGFTNYEITYYPLCFETSPYDIEKSVSSKNYRIAIFTRLSSMKPLDPFFYSLKILVEWGLNVELYIYGAGNPEKLGMIRQLEYLYIRDRVKFLGHVESIPDALKENKPDLIWYQSANKEPGGYAAFEVSMSGLPQVFWDFMDMAEHRSIEKVFPSFTNLLSFSRYSREIILSPEKQSILGNQQRDYVIENYSIKKHIHILEELFI